MADDFAQIIRVTVDASGAREGAEEAKQHLANIEDQARKTGEGVNLLGDIFKGVVAAFSIEKIIEGFRALVEAMDGLQKQAEKLNVSTDWLQELQLAAASSSVKIGDATNALDKFARSVGNAALGNRQATQAFQDMGLKILDAGGHVRPLNDLFVEAAQRLTGMSDASKVNALSMQTMGRQAQAVIPMLERVANLQVGGANVQTENSPIPLSMTATLDQGNAVDRQIADLQRLASANASAVPPETIQRWADLGSAMEKLALRVRDFAANNLVGAAVAAFSVFEAAVRGVLVVVQALVSSLEYLQRLFAQNTAPGAVIAGLQQSIAQRQAVRDRAISYQQAQQRNPFQSVANFPGVDVSNPTGQVSQLDTEIAAMKAQLDDLQRQQVSQGRSAARGDELRTPPLLPPTTGTAFAQPRVNGQSLQRGQSRLTTDAQLATQAAGEAVIAAMNGGADAVARVEEHLKNATALANLYEKAGINVTSMTKDQRAQFNAEVDTLDRLAERTKTLNNLKTSILSTQDLREQNNELALQASLQGQNSTEIARQVDRAKALYAFQKQGILDLAASNEKGSEAARQEVQDKLDAIDAQARLKQLVEDTAKSQALALQPFSSAISSIQNDFSTLFEGILKGSKNLWQSFADVAKQAVIKLVAELAVLLTIRPVISAVVGSVFSPGAAQSLGYGPGVSGIGGLGTILGGGGSSQQGAVTLIPNGSGGYSVSSGGASGGGLGGFSLGGGGAGSFLPSGWMDMPIFQNIDQEIAGWSTYGTAAQAGSGLFSSSATFGQALGAVGSVAGIGMGVNTLLNSNGSAGSLVSGGSSVLAGGLGLASLIPGMQFLAPFALAAGVGGGLLGGLLGGGGPQIPPMPALSYGSGSFSFNPQTGHYETGGDSLGSGSALNSTAGTIAQKVLDLIDQAGGTPVAGKLYGGTIAAGTTHNLNGQNWQPQAYTQADYVSPSGQVTRISYNDTSMNLQQQAERLIGAVFSADVLNGGVAGNISATLKTVLASNQPTTVAAAQADITNSRLYDKILAGQDPTLTSAEQSFAKIRSDLESISDWAATNGLDTSVIQAAEQQALQKVGTDFMKSINDGILGITDPLQAQLNALADQRDTAMKEAQSIADTLGASFVDMAKVSAFYSDQANQLTKNFWASTVSSLQSAIQQLSYGALSGASPSTAFFGAQATFNATWAAAQTGDTTSIQQLAADASSYVQAGQSYYGNSQQFADLVAEVRGILAGEQALLQAGGPGATPAVSTDAANAVLQSNAANSAQMAQLMETVNALLAQNADLTAQISRLVVNQGSRS